MHFNFSRDVFVSDDDTIGEGHMLSSSYFNNVPNGHDVQLMTGSINITFYGPYVKEGSSYKP